MQTPLNQAERTELLGLARAAVLSLSAATALPPLPPLTGRLGEPGGAFVTIRLGGKLRGCIGVVEATDPVAQVVREMAVRAASKDPRFDPLSPEEAASPDLELEVSVLTQPTALRGALPDAVQIGRHGLIVSGRGRRGLLLPQVATDRDWTPTQFLDHTCIKAGLPAHAWRDADTTVSAFTAEVF